MNYKLNGNILDLAIKLSSSNLNLESSSELSDEIILDFAELRKNTIEEYFDFDFENGKLELKEKKGGVGFLPFINRGVKSEITITIPDNSKLTGNISSISGDVILGNFDYKGSLQSVSGNIFAGNIISDQIKLKTVSGDINIASLIGALNIENVSGDVKIQDASFSYISVNSISGDIDFSGIFNLIENGKISSISGDIALSIKEYIGESIINLNTLSGDIDITGIYPREKILCKRKMSIKKDLSELKNSFKPIINTTKNSFGKLKNDFKNLENKIVKEVNVAFSSDKDEKQEENNLQIKNQEKLIDKVLDMVSSDKITANEAEKLINSLRNK